MKPRLPNDMQRLSIVGRTGSGKTVAAAWHLSNADFDRKPWIVYDFKRDQLLAEIGDLDGAEHIDTGFVPTKPGVYFVHPHPDDSLQVQAQMWKIWANGNTGVYCDEGYMVCGPDNRNSAFRSLLTQGRSLRIPMIVLSQRPVWLDRFVFSESDFYQLFHLNHIGDRRKMMEYIPADLNAPLDDFHSYYHDVGRNQTFVFKPSPKPEAIVKTFDRRLAALRKKPRLVAI